MERQLKTAAIKNYTIHLDESVERDDGSVFTDHQVRGRFKAKGLANPQVEWMECTLGRPHAGARGARAGLLF